MFHSSGNLRSRDGEGVVCGKCGVVWAVWCGLCGVGLRSVVLVCVVWCGVGCVLWCELFSVVLVGYVV